MNRNEFLQAYLTFTMVVAILSTFALILEFRYLEFPGGRMEMAQIFAFHMGTLLLLFATSNSLGRKYWATYYPSNPEPNYTRLNQLQYFTDQRILGAASWACLTIALAVICFLFAKEQVLSVVSEFSGEQLAIATFTTPGIVGGLSAWWRVHIPNPPKPNLRAVK